MPERINTPFTNEHFTDWCLKMAEKYCSHDCYIRDRFGGKHYD